MDSCIVYFKNSDTWYLAERLSDVTYLYYNLNTHFQMTHAFPPEKYLDGNHDVFLGLKFVNYLYGVDNG